MLCERIKSTTELSCEQSQHIDERGTESFLQIFNVFGIENCENVLKVLLTY